MSRIQREVFSASTGGRQMRPKRNRDFWLEKFRVNRIRDERVIRELEKLGFSCTVIWECEVQDKPSAVEAKLRHLFEPKDSVPDPLNS